MSHARRRYRQRDTAPGLTELRASLDKRLSKLILSSGNTREQRACYALILALMQWVEAREYRDCSEFKLKQHVSTLLERQIDTETDVNQLWANIPSEMCPTGKKGLNSLMNRFIRLSKAPARKLDALRQERNFIARSLNRGTRNRTMVTMTMFSRLAQHI